MLKLILALLSHEAGKCPIIWASKLQSQVALSTTEAEYIAMSMALRDVIPVMELLNEMKGGIFQFCAHIPSFTVMSLRTPLVHLNLPNSQSYVH